MDDPRPAGRPELHTFVLTVVHNAAHSWRLDETAFAQAEWRRQCACPLPALDVPVTVVVPAYNEDHGILVACVDSILRQSYAGALEVVVVDDGSREPLPDFDQLRPLLRAGRTLTYHRQPTNRGKREAQAVAFAKAQGALIVTVDSDTELAPDAIARATAPFANPRVGAVTGVALVANRDCLLARLIHLRYWSAFHAERAAQSLFGVVTCCSGVFSIYRGELIERLTPRYLAQRFLGKPCHYGDDRHLTNLILAQGYEVKLASDALAWTQAPTSLRVWMKQQLRWSKSFYRELLWSLGFGHRCSWYFLYCLLFQALLPLLLAWGLGRGLVLLAAGDARVALGYLASTAFMAWLRGAYGWWRTREADFLYMPLYGFLHAGLIFPVRLVALLTLWDNRWATR
ncbi:MAG: glycosyltransferase [Armatimonadetes bacterium]|nr:glycosyltransferase [Armatimonadota bacterium]